MRVRNKSAKNDILPVDLMYILFNNLTPPILLNPHLRHNIYTEEMQEYDKILFRNIRLILSISKNWRELFRNYVIKTNYKFFGTKVCYRYSLCIFARSIEMNNDNQFIKKTKNIESMVNLGIHNIKIGRASCRERV